MTEVAKLRHQLQQMAKYGSALAVLDWDEQVYMPSAARAFRGEVKALISADLHKRFTSSEFVKLVKKLQQPQHFNSLTDDEKVIVRETWRDLEKSLKIPVEFVEKLTKLTTESYAAWVDARQKSDFRLFRPYLQQIVAMKQKEAELIGYSDSPYDALLDGFEPDLTTRQVEELFSPLAAEISQLIKQLKNNSSFKLPKTEYPIEQQKLLNDELAKALGYDLDSGRIDETPHPFTTGFHPTDVRITTRYNKDDFYMSVGPIIHEVGHALYEQGLSAKEFGTPLGEAVSLGIHESQSRIWENFVGRSPEFCHFLNTLLVKYFPKTKLSDEQLHRYLNKVEPSLIRVEADEVTYNLHVILRFELEKDLIEGKLNVTEVSEAWNAKMKQYLNVEVRDDAHGVLQDVHWSYGALGYFPTYTLGSMYAAQFFNKAQTEIPGLTENFSKGEFKGFLKWLRKNIHQHGSRYRPEELAKRVTGEPLNSKYLIKHLESKINFLK